MLEFFRLADSPLRLQNEVRQEQTCSPLVPLVQVALSLVQQALWITEIYTNINKQEERSPDFVITNRVIIVKL